MNQNDISAIFPIDGVQQEHYLESSDIISKSLSPEDVEGKPVASQQNPNIFYHKVSMKMLLQQRALVFHHLKLSLKPPSSSMKKIQPQIPIDDMHNIVRLLFEQFPPAFDPLHFVFIMDCGTAYGFFAGDGKYVPLCKKCNVSVYIVIRNHVARVVCCNPKCKIKLLGQTMIQAEKKSHMKPTKTLQSRASVSKLEQQSKSIKIEQHQQQKARKLTVEEIMKIRKAVDKITNS